MQQLLGNEHLISQFRSTVLEGKAAHAYLLCGAAGSGKKTLAGIMAQMLMCDAAGCDECIACQKIEKNIHPDLIRLRGANKNGTYSVDQIREIRKDALIYPNEGRKKIYILENAETMTPAAQDAFLKILEEPPVFVVFILLCNDESKMLSTILSRVIRLAPRLPALEESARWIGSQVQISEQMIRTALGVTMGNPGQALSLLQSGKLEQRIQLCERFTKVMLTGTSYELAVISHGAAADRTEFSEFLKTLSLYFRDILVYKTTADIDALIFSESISVVSGYFPRIRTEGIGTVIESLLQLAAQAVQAINITLLEMRLVTLVKEELF